MRLLDKKAIYEVFKRWQSNNPEPKGELYWKNTFTLLVAVVLSAQATDVGVNKATKVLFEVASSPEEILKLGEENLKEYIKTINLYPTKAKRIIGLSEQILREFGGKVPCSREALESLPGVGRKTANVVLNIGFGMPAIAVDTHILRTAPRIGLSDGKTPREVEEDLLRITPEEFLPNAHHWILLHGRYICQARKPKCAECFLEDICCKNGVEAI
ncbi:endonuclease III [Treponema phagedenis]|uniref:endonuclease III n=1 Tax=Treponema phagedenis TaxID=162 RepID=UPI0004663FDE|nr:endonuclease III [Treponema phagedenis]NVP25459.1 endonuclease III [Treponema phagedenis]QKS91302.1 endonuclease III [Treponema phagedenis]QLC57412.1 endonuclease III [Treponema phagedenis]